MGQLFYILPLQQQRGEKGFAYLKRGHHRGDTIKSLALDMDIYQDDLYRFLKSKGFTDEDWRILHWFHRWGQRRQRQVLELSCLIQDEQPCHRIRGTSWGRNSTSIWTQGDKAVWQEQESYVVWTLHRSSREKFIILCEGIYGCYHNAPAGFTNAVAALGTAFTEGQPGCFLNVILMKSSSFDSDDGRQRAILRAIPILKTHGQGPET